MTPGPFAISVTAATGVLLAMGKRIAINSSGNPVAAGAAQRFLGTLKSDINGDFNAQRTGALMSRHGNLHTAIYGSGTDLSKGDAIMGAGAGKVDKWAAIAIATAMPAANANVTSTGFDLSLDPEPGIQLEVVIPALPSLVDTKVATFTVMDSADNVTFTAIGSIDAFTRTGAGGAGSAALTRNFTLPRNVRQYVAVKAAVENGGGSNIAVNYTMNILLPKIGTALASAGADGDQVEVVFW